MTVALFVLVLLCMAGMLHVEASDQSGENSLTENGQGLGRRYAESTIASDMSKIMDSMVQKNFVNFLLNQKEKKSMSNVIPEEDPGACLYNNLLKKLALCIRSKGHRSMTQ
ncbi:gastric inhibitory polypeptide [Oncorhynchus mykiss]|uniref:gastric inhibitory polypeptide n=1 Tax=Oncorhynchus mykiss TaxID=8022 RepID=UPI0018777F7E|nr:gastric inhibitory polypeptide [Oncorhynchus mykiss]